MSGVSATFAQLLSRSEPAADPAAAAARLARAAVDMLQQRSGQPVTAKVVAQLPGGFTQLSTGSDVLVLKLETTLPTGTPVTIRSGSNSQGQPVVTVEVQLQAGPVLPVPTPLPQLLAGFVAQASASPVQVPEIPVAAQPPAPQPAQPATPPTAAPTPAPPPSPLEMLVAAAKAMLAQTATPLAGNPPLASNVPTGTAAAPPTTAVLPASAMPAANAATPGTPPPIPPTALQTPVPSNGSMAATVDLPVPPPAPNIPTSSPANSAAPAQQPAAPVAQANLPPQSAPPSVATLPPATPASAVQIPTPSAPQLANPSLPPAPAGVPAAIPPAQPQAAVSSPGAVPPAAQPLPASATPQAAMPPVEPNPIRAAVPPSIPAAVSSAPLPEPAIPPAPQPFRPISAPPQMAAAPSSDEPTSVLSPANLSVAAPASPKPQFVARSGVSAPLPQPQPVTATAFTLADPVQAAARQESAAPLLAKIAALAASSAALPRPVVEAAIKLLATRIDLNAGPPDAASIKEAVLKAGVLLEPGHPQAADSKSALLQLRSALLGFLGGDTASPAPILHRTPPPLRGDQARAPRSEGLPAVEDAPRDAARALLGHTEGALSRLKLLQLASQNPDPQARAAASPAEWRLEVPMLLGAETGIMQMLIERDGRNKAKPGERGWRMRFALNFSSFGEIGAEVALLGKTANVAIWAADPATANALEAMLPELAPALAARGLSVAGIRLRRGVPAAVAAAPGRLLDSAR